MEALELGDIEMMLVAEQPLWLGEAMAATDPAQTGPGPLDLGQLCLFHHFNTLQVDVATDAAWLGYPALTREGRPDAEEGEDEAAIWRTSCLETLAILLECPGEDATIYADTFLGEDEVADDIAKVEEISRHARLASDLNIGAVELLALKELSSSDVSGDRAAAAAAARAGLSRFNGGSQMPLFDNAVAEIKRDALLAVYMRTRVATDPVLAAKVVDREALYSHLLLDVNVTSAVPTSRFVEATSSLQLYIDRALNGLEETAEFHDREALAAQWQIDRSYRLWEANAKLQLYPQNYIEPALRYITSPEFKTLLQTVSGGDLNEDSVETAINAYMSGLATCCDLRLCSVHRERSNEETSSDTATYHFLTSAQWKPRRFFYRKLEADFGTISRLTDPSQYLKALDWTFWQEVVVPKTYDLISNVAVCFFDNR
ncbi:neuraminidase-like domain-containing protein [Breoghania sp.]|uniref:neuraminidase-like domain-containing protein n=1 Tax=Breoghania sp. TaxID=2065378 RepID=UPI00261BCB84|nr:neuraminidase-like domain-containing protein [Breoghania sp.]MDJ0933685.1 neuraminidase-like domain-containing protein [Breoghania sp.]